MVVVRVVVERAAAAKRVGVGTVKGARAGEGRVLGGMRGVRSVAAVGLAATRVDAAHGGRGGGRMLCAGVH